MQRCCCKGPSSSYSEIENPYFTGRATVPESTRISQPSDTFFVVPHPDDSTTGVLETTQLVSPSEQEVSSGFQKLPMIAHTTA